MTFVTTAHSDTQQYDGPGHWTLGGASPTAHMAEGACETIVWSTVGHPHGAGPGAGGSEPFINLGFFPAATRSEPSHSTGLICALGLTKVPPNVSVTISQNIMWAGGWKL